MVNSISDSVQILSQYWKEQGIMKTVSDIKKIEDSEKLNGFTLPSDFKEFYSLINGMEGLYPNEIDKNGFLFYPIEAVVPVAVECPNSKMENINRIFLFSEYLQVSWWYGCDVIANDNYSIGIIADRDSFKPICNSLVRFLELYMSDDPILYNYK